jgi:DnaJ-domain-containing protein 1
MPAPLVFVFVLLGLLLFVFDGPTAAAARGGNNNNSFNKPNQFHRDSDPYQVLGVKRTASDDEIQKSYRKRAKETHRMYYLSAISLFRSRLLRESLIFV